MKSLQRIITLSVVSHNQAELLENFLQTIDETGAGDYLHEVIVTNNLPEDVTFNLKSTPIRIINNDNPKGFGANHNQAFKHSSGQYFCVVNPDITLKDNPFPVLLKTNQHTNAGLTVPIVMAPDNSYEDSLRYFPSLWSIFKKVLNLSDGRFPAQSEEEPFDIEWAAGMFMLFNRQAFNEVGGFDEDFFLYYEDVDICLRLLQAGKRVLACPQAEVVHEPQRSSHRKLRYLIWHLSSLLKYMFKHRALINPPMTNVK